MSGHYPSAKEHAFLTSFFRRALPGIKLVGHRKRKCYSRYASAGLALLPLPMTVDESQSGSTAGRLLRGGDPSRAYESCGNRY